MAWAPALTILFTGSKWVLFRNPDIKVLAINTSEFHAEKLDAVRCVGDAKATLEAIGRKLKKAGYKSGYTDEIQEIRQVWEKERLRVLGVQYHGEGFGEGKICSLCALLDGKDY